MRRNKRNSLNFGTKSEEGLFTLQDAIRKIQELEERLLRLENPLGGASFPQRTPTRRGPKTHIEHAEVVRRREKLIPWIERRWPTLSIALARAQTPGEAAAAIRESQKIQPFLFMPPFYDEPERFAEQLWDFLHDERNRYRGNPRNLCGAMAGLPEIAWKTSFDICSRNPSLASMQPEAYRDYLRRKFLDRLRELDHAQSVDEVHAILRRSPSKDRHYLWLRENAQDVLKWLALGRPCELSPVSSDLPITNSG